MRNKKSTILIAVIFLAGLSLLLYPFIANQWNAYRQKRLISNYDSTVEKMAAAGKINYGEEWAQANDYNARLLPSILPDSFADAKESSERDDEYMSALNLTGDGMMGYVRIPKINVNLPLFHTVDEEVLETAVGHLEGSSLPVGGEDTHSVLSAHRGLPSATLFTDLDKLEEGDHFLLCILDDMLCYQVDKITVVEPDDTEALMADQDQDLATLLTCTPYGGNSHRLLVRGHRVPYDGELESTPADTMVQAIQNYYMLYLLAGLGVTALIILAMRRVMGKRRRQTETKLEKEKKNREEGKS